MLHYGKSSGIISDNKLIHLPLCYKTTVPCRGVTRRGKGRAIPRAPNHYRGAEKSQQCQKYFLQYSKFASIRSQIPNVGAKLASCPGPHLTSLRPWYHADLLRNHRLHWQQGRTQGGGGWG